MVRVTTHFGLWSHLFFLCCISFWLKTERFRMQQVYDGRFNTTKNTTTEITRQREEKSSPLKYTQLNKEMRRCSKAKKNTETKKGER